MAIENDFLPFAVGSGANVLTQAQYAALTSLLQNGFSAGIAPSVQLNKVWRQSSIMASVIAQFIAQQTGQNAIDDGTTATLLANLTAAIGASSPGVVGATRNLSMSVTAASATATLTADEIIVETALGGLRYCLPSFSKTINLATTGAGGMDTGTAPASGFVALYAIYNPTSGASTLLATNATSAVAPNVYGGANMPSGYTASALASVWPTNSSGQFAVGLQRDRHIAIGVINALTTTTQQPSYTSLSLSSVVPKNAISVDGVYTIAISGSGSSQLAMAVSGASIGLGQQTFVANVTWASGQGYAGSFRAMTILSAQTMYYSATLSAGTAGNIQISVTGYDF